MAGLDVVEGKGGRRNLAPDLQPIPMIDLMLVTIAFLLITAVWTHMERLNANANVPNDPAAPVTETQHQKTLHVELVADHFLLTWRDGANILERVEVPAHRVEEHDGPLRVVRYPGLSAGVTDTWTRSGMHRDASDRTLDRAVLHAPDTLPYADLVAMMDAVHSVKRPLPSSKRGESISAFDVTMANH